MKHHIEHQITNADNFGQVVDVIINGGPDYSVSSESQTHAIGIYLRSCLSSDKQFLISPTDYLGLLECFVDMLNDKGIPAGDEYLHHDASGDEVHHLNELTKNHKRSIFASSLDLLAAYQETVKAGGK